MAEALRAQASVICLQHPSLPPLSVTEQVSLKKKKKPGQNILAFKLVDKVGRYFGPFYSSFARNRRMIITFNFKRTFKEDMRFQYHLSNFKNVQLQEISDLHMNHR